MKLDEEAIAFNLDSPEITNDSIDKLVSLLGEPVKLLGLGEALHGGEEILIFRNRLFQRLVEKHGYSAIAIESSFPRGRLINDYVAGRVLSSYEAVAKSGFSHGFGQLEANRELVEWMRQYNAHPSHKIKLQFYGFDSPTEMCYADSPGHILRFVLDYVSAIDDACGNSYRQKIEPLIGEDSDWEDPATLFDPDKSIGLSPAAKALRIELEDLIAELLVRRPELISWSGKERYSEAVHYARLARWLLVYHAVMAERSSQRTSRLLGIRDLCMAQNLAYILSCEQGRGRTLAFAHNSHLKKGRMQWQFGSELFAWWPAGSHLKEILGERYAVIGSALGVSDENGIGWPEAGTLEALLTALPGPGRFISTRRVQELSAAQADAIPVRSGSLKNPTYFPLTADSLADFDWLVIQDGVGYGMGGPPLPG
ncbi:MAG TPA: erythromycin esterase family protein [Methanothrix sp.]|nr:erythromycin esterase family protein [Methanothrix sp.]